MAFLSLEHLRAKFMAKKKPHKKGWTVETPKHRGKVCRTLLVVDNAPLLKGHRARYQKVLKEVSKAEQELVRHQSKDGPEFERWYHSTFGKQLTELRKGEEEIHQSARILIDVDEMVMRDGCADYIAYHRIKLREQGLPDPYEAKAEKNRPHSPAAGLIHVCSQAATCEIHSNINDIVVMRHCPQQKQGRSAIAGLELNHRVLAATAARRWCP